MSLSKKIAAALDENTKAYVLPCTVTVEDSPSRLTLNLTALDTVGLAFSTMEFANTSRTEWSSDALKEWGDRLSKRVTYLMEPLKVLEVNDQGGEVQMRSQSPTPRDRPAGLLRNAALPAGKPANGTLRLRRDDSPAPAGPLPAHARDARTAGGRHRRQRRMSPQGTRREVTIPLPPSLTRITMATV